MASWDLMALANRQLDQTSLWKPHILDRSFNQEKGREFIISFLFFFFLMKPEPIIVQDKNGWKWAYSNGETGGFFPLLSIAPVGSMSFLGSSCFLFLHTTNKGNCFSLKADNVPLNDLYSTERKNILVLTDRDKHTHGHTHWDKPIALGT